MTSASANAQTTTYSNATAGTINSSTACPTSLTRTFTVGSGITVADVNIGIHVTHTYRGDLRFTLVSPSGTRVQIVNGPGGAANDVDNFNVLLDDEATGGSVASYTSAAGGSAPPYTVSLTPQALLSAFDGQNAAGTWTLEMCDTYAQADDGNFVRADLYIANLGPQADLSVTKTVSSTSPVSGGAITYTVTVTNASASTLTASGVQIRDVLPAGVSYVSSTSANGSYSPATGLWTLSNSLAPGASATLTIAGTVTATQGASVTNWAEVWTSSANDNDSTPGNSSTTEDDDASATFTVSGTRVAGTPPTLSCPAGSTSYSWQNNWTAGATSGNVTIGNIGTATLDFTMAGGVYTDGTPLVSNASSYGLATPPYALKTSVDFSSNTGSVTMVYNFPNTPVPGVQFRVFDVDWGNNSWADRLTITASLKGVPVPLSNIITTNGLSNYSVGNVLIGDASSGYDESRGTAYITINAPFDQITIVYDNNPLNSPSNPNIQLVEWDGFSKICLPDAQVTSVKSSTIISDPVNGTTNPKMIPGAVVRYCIVVRAAGSATIRNVSVSDPLPASVTYVPGTMKSGIVTGAAATCTAATTAEDDDATGADETDPAGMSITGTTVTATRTSLDAVNSFVMTLDATIK